MGGTVVERELAAGEELHVDTGCLVAYTPSVDFDLLMAGGVKSVLFGGEGLFFARLRGPGKVWIQSLPFSRLAGRMLAAAGPMGGQNRGEGSVLGAPGRPRRRQPLGHVGDPGEDAAYPKHGATDAGTGALGYPAYRYAKHDDVPSRTRPARRVAGGAPDHSGALPAGAGRPGRPGALQRRGEVLSRSIRATCAHDHDLRVRHVAVDRRT